MEKFSKKRGKLRFSEAVKRIIHWIPFHGKTLYFMPDGSVRWILPPPGYTVSVTTNPVFEEDDVELGLTINGGDLQVISVPCSFTVDPGDEVYWEMYINGGSASGLEFDHWNENPFGIEDPQPSGGSFVVNKDYNLIAYFKES